MVPPPVQAVFSPSGLSLHFDQGPEPIQKLSYDCFECVIETQDLLLPVRDGRVIILQKKDLPAGALRNCGRACGSRSST